MTEPHPPQLTLLLAWGATLGAVEEINTLSLCGQQPGCSAGAIVVGKSCWHV